MRIISVDPIGEKEREFFSRYYPHHRVLGLVQTELSRIVLLGMKRGYKYEFPYNCFVEYYGDYLYAGYSDYELYSHEDGQFIENVEV